MELGLQVVGALALATTVLFSLAEGALYHFSPSRLEQMRGRRISSQASRAAERSGELLLMTHLAGGLSQALFIFCLALILPSEDSAALMIGLALGLVAILGGGSLVPLAMTRYNAERLFLFSVPLLRITFAVMAPLAAAGAPVARALSRLLRLRETQSIEEEVQEDILSAVQDGEREGVIQGDEKEMIEGIIDLRDEDVADIMTPRTEMFSLQVDTPLADVIAVVSKAGHSRVPVYGENRDNILGVLYVKDLLKFWRELESRDRTVRDIVRPPVFVPESKKIGELLTQFRTERVHLAVVVDEYGGTAGLITIEDILEEIVGEIRDEFDELQPADPTITMTGERSAVVDARVHIVELNEKLHLDFPEDEGFDTVGGFICSIAGHVPEPREQIRHQEVTFTVLAADDRRIHSLEVTLPAATPE